MPTTSSTAPRTTRRLAALALAVAFTTLLAAAIVARPVDAQPPTLRQQIHDSIANSRLIPYTSNTMTDTWDVMSLADVDPTNRMNILTIYGNASFPGASGQNPNWEHEHLWPQSYGTGDDSACGYPRNDLHHLFPSEPELNQSRGNLVFGDCHGADCTEKGAGNWMRGGANGLWEVWEGRRGDVARAMLYMDVRYEGGKHPGTDCVEPDLVLTNDRSLIVSQPMTPTVAYMGMLSALLYWAGDDDVDYAERHRNDVVERYQGNRNPFVDDNGLACRLWPTEYGCATDGPPDTATPTSTRLPTHTATSTPRESPTADLTREAQRNWLYLPLVEKSIPPTPRPPMISPTPAPTGTPRNTQVPPPLRTPTPPPVNTPAPTPTEPPTPSPFDLRIFTMQCDGTDEVVRIVNYGPSPVNLSGWSILSVVGSQTFSFPSYVLEPGSTAGVHSGPDAPLTSGSEFRWTTAYIWNGNGDEAQLKDPAGAVADDRNC